MNNLFSENRLIHFAVGSRARAAAARAANARAAAARRARAGIRNQSSRTVNNLRQSISQVEPRGASRSFRVRPQELQLERFGDKQEARDIVKRTRPDLYRTDEQLRQSHLPGVLRQFNIDPRTFGTSAAVGKTRKANRQLAYLVRRGRLAQERERSTLVKRVFQRLQRRDLTAETQKISEENRARQERQAEEVRIQRETERAQAQEEADKRSDTIRSSIERRPATAGGRVADTNVSPDADLTFGADISAALAGGDTDFSAAFTKFAEAPEGQRTNVAKEIIANSPFLSRQFLEYQDFLKQYNEADDATRNKMLSELEQQAKDAVDPFYDSQKGFLQRGVELGERSLEFSRSKAIEDAQRGFTRGMEDLTIGTGEALATKASELERRHVLDSGIARLVAERFIDVKDRGARRLAENLATTESRAGEAFRLGLDDLRLEQERREDVLERARKMETQTELGGIMSDLEMLQFLAGGEAAQEIFEPAPTDPITPEPAETFVSGTGAITARTRPGSTPQQRSDERREQRLLQKRAQQRLPTPQRDAAGRLPVSTTPVSARPDRARRDFFRTGSALQQSAARRRAQRLARL